MGVYELIGQIADRVEAELDAVVAAMDEEIIAAVPALGADEAIRAEARESSRGNVRRYLAVARRAPNPPPPDVPPEALDFARTVVRRGIESDVIYHGYRQGQQTLWRYWKGAAQRTAASPAELAEALDVSLELLFRYVDQILGRVVAEVQHEREQVLGGALARRAETIRLLLDGAPLDLRAASARLQHDLERDHTALVVWTHASDVQQGLLETSASAIAQASGAGRPLTLAAATTALWAWLVGGGAAVTVASADLSIDPRVRVAVGPRLPGVAGFRRSHEAALTIQRLMERNPAGAQLATYEELEITTLAGQDERRAGEFIARTLGPLIADTPTAARLRETLRVFLEEAENAPRAARRLNTHRNTVLQRVGRATELLGYRPGERRLALELALELLRHIQPKLIGARES